MSDILRTGLQWLAGQLESSCSETVTYTQGATSVQVAATYGAKLLKLGEKFDGRVVHSDGDFMLNAATIKAAFAAKGATFTAPNRGDLIAVTFADGTTQKHLRYRIHTKKLQ